MSPTCIKCRYAPCACEYIGSLMPGGVNESLAPVALAARSQPRPHRGLAETSCPCPSCWSARAATWEGVA